MASDPGLSPTAAELTFSAELVRRREAALLSQHALALKVAFSRAYISRAEKPGGLFSSAAARAVDVALDAGGVLVDLHERAVESRRARRSRLAESFSETSATTRYERVAPDSTGGGVDVSTSLMSRIGASLDALIVDDLEDRVDALANRYFDSGLSRFSTEATQLRERAHDLLAIPLTSRQRRRIHAALAALSGMLAQSAFAVGDRTDAHCAVAIALAEEAGHRELVGWVRGTQAQIALHTGNPVAAVRYAEAGRESRPGSTAAVRAATYLARANARLGDDSAARRAWRWAEHAWGELEGALTPSVFSLSLGYLDCCELTVVAWLGDGMWARRLPDVQGPARTPTVGSAIRELDIGLIRIGQGDVEEAVAAGHRALSIGAPRWTTPLAERFAGLLDVLSPYRLPAVDELRERARWISA